MVDYKLGQKVVLITGANHGIGAATAKKFAAEGASVFITYYRPPAPFADDVLKQYAQSGVTGDEYHAVQQQQSADAVVQAIGEAGHRAQAMECDLATIAQIPAVFDACEAAFGGVDVLVANHTHDILQTFDPALVSDNTSLLTAASIDRHFDVNVRATALLIQEYFRRYQARGASDGRIITISTPTERGHVGNINYSASKAALENYTSSAAQELGPYGIRANVVVPGPTQTGYITPDFEQELVNRTPLRRIGMPDDIADVIVFLASASGQWVNGAVIPVNGGF